MMGYAGRVRRRRRGRHAAALHEHLDRAARRHALSLCTRWSSTSPARMVMGLVTAWFAMKGGAAGHLRLFLATGVLGGYTTFSAFSLDAVLLWERHEHLLAALYVGGSVVRLAARPGRRPLDHEDRAGVTRQAFDVVVLGAGAAGLMCAIRAGQRGRRVLLLDHAEKVGKKILISGGGRCNFTNRDSAARGVPLGQPAFLQVGAGALHAARLHRPGRQAPHRLAREDAGPAVLRRLGAADRGDAAGRMRGGRRRCAGRRIASPSIEKADRFAVRTDKGDFERRRRRAGDRRPVDPQDGRDRLRARHRAPLRPQDHADAAGAGAVHREGAGASAAWRSTVVARCGKAAFREAMLFTHRGLSGPAILQISSYWKPGQEIVDRPAARPRRRAVPEGAPACAAQGRAAHDPGRGDAAAARRPCWPSRAPTTLNDWRITPTGTEGYAKAEVTLGGIDTDELSSQTMEARKVPGLFVIGEAVDVTGWLGGYNFQWAWSSGWAAGEAVWLMRLWP